MKTVNVGVFGTSWWADTMYLPPLDNHPGAKVAAVCGRNPATAAAFAATWNVPASYTDAAAMFDGEDLDAVVIATATVLPAIAPRDAWWPAVIVLAVSLVGVIVLVLVSITHGPAPRWRWGRRSDDDPAEDL